MNKKIICFGVISILLLISLAPITTTAKVVANDYEDLSYEGKVKIEVKLAGEIIVFFIPPSLVITKLIRQYYATVQLQRKGSPDNEVITMQKKAYQRWWLIFEAEIEITVDEDGNPIREGNGYEIYAEGRSFFGFGREISNTESFNVQDHWKNALTPYVSYEMIL
jgi:hypothetical protein